MSVNESRTIQPVDPERYGYASGRVRALEAKLMDSAALARLFDARQPEDLTRMLQEAGYEPGDAEQALQAQGRAIYTLLGEIMPDQGFCEALLLFHDCHNLKGVLKYLSAWWVKPEPAAEPADDTIRELPESEAGLAYQGLEGLMQIPSLIDPAVLFRSIRDRRPELVPDWLYDLAGRAAQRYLQSYDTARMDMLIDYEAWKQATHIAELLKNDFFIGYLALRRDLINLEILLRCRSLHTGREFMRLTLLPEASLSTDELLDVYSLEADDFLAWMATLPIAGRLGEDELSNLVAEYGRPGTAAHYNRLADQLVLEWLDQAKRVLRGPEIPLAYLLRRELEIKNIRIVITCMRNGLPPAKARDLARGQI